jgi:hypothetical protein
MLQKLRYGSIYTPRNFTAGIGEAEETRSIGKIREGYCRYCIRIVIIYVQIESGNFGFSFSSKQF